MKRSCPRLFIVTSPESAGWPEFHQHVERILAVGGGECALQLRAHGLSGGEVLDLADELRAVTRRHEAGLWINDRIDVALAIRADGVQLGSRSMDIGSARRLLGQSCWIGCSIHAAAEVGLVDADMYLLGNVFDTSSHPTRTPLGVKAVRAAARAGRPIVGIGGITPERTKEVIASGAWGVAVLSGVWGTEDPAAATAGYVRALEAAVSCASGA